MTPRGKAWALTLGTILGAGLFTWALLTGLMVLAYVWSDIPTGEAITGALSNWPFTLGFASLVGLGSLSGFEPGDLGSIGTREGR